MKGFKHPTSNGPVFIVPYRERWIVLYDDENLGSYHSPEAAADDVAGGHTDSPSNGVDLGDLGISENINDWVRL